MRVFSANSFRLQVVVSVLASLSMLALAFILVREVLLSTEQAFVRNAQQQCSNAAAELLRQFVEQGAVRTQPIDQLPFPAQDVSLRGLSIAVLNPFDGVSGGYWLIGLERYAGVSEVSQTNGPWNPTPADRAFLDGLVRKAAAAGERQAGAIAHGRDILVAAAIAGAGDKAVAWTTKRLAGVRDPVLAQRRWWIAALILSTLIGLGGIISISLRLRQGVQFIKAGLHRLENDFSYRLPVNREDFGEISDAINQMAERRASLERTLRRQDRLAALGKVVGGVAHEIRNPLNSMRLTLELLNRRIRKGVATGEEVEGAVEEIDRLDRILARLLEFGRTGLEERRVQDLVPLLQRAMHLARDPADRKQVRLELRTPEGGALEANVDGLQTEQVVLNLLLNGIDASPPEQAVILTARRRDGWMEICVTDKGPGIPDEVRDHVFDPYFTTKEAGSGLGLAISSEVAANHGGSLEFVTGDRGTQFVLRIPIERGDI